MEELRAALSQFLITNDLSQLTLLIHSDQSEQDSAVEELADTPLHCSGHPRIFQALKRDY